MTDFVRRRTTQENGLRDPLQKLRDVTGDRSYAQWEVARPDKFVDAYIGKDYNSKGASEAFTMGVERMSPERWREFYDEDPEHFGMILSLLNGQVER